VLLTLIIHGKKLVYKEDRYFDHPKNDNFPRQIIQPFNCCC